MRVQASAMPVFEVLQDELGVAHADVAVDDPWALAFGALARVVLEPALVRYVEHSETSFELESEGSERRKSPRRAERDDLNHARLQCHGVEVARRALHVGERMIETILSEPALAGIAHRADPYEHLRRPSEVAVVSLASDHYFAPFGVERHVAEVDQRRAFDGQHFKVDALDVGEICAQ